MPETPTEVTRDAATKRTGSVLLDTSINLAAGVQHSVTRDPRADRDTDTIELDNLGDSKRSGRNSGSQPSTSAGGAYPSVESAGPSKATSSTRRVVDLRPKNFTPVGKKTGVPVIKDTSGLTKEWLTQVFRFRGLLSKDGTIDEIKARSIGEGQGEYGDLSLLTIVKATGGSSELPKNLIAKMCPQSANLSGWLLKNIYLNEAHFYNDFTVEHGGLPRPEWCAGAQLS